VYQVCILYTYIIMTNTKKSYIYYYQILNYQTYNYITNYILGVANNKDNYKYCYAYEKNMKINKYT